jgi:cytochrome c-type biogenesis protein CcmH/NrfG
MCNRELVNLFVLVSMGALCAGLCSCGNSRRTPTQAIEAELAARKARQAESTALFEKAQTAYSGSDVDLARKRLRQSVELDDQNVRAWMALGAVEYRAGNLYDAAQAFDKAGRLAPTRYEPHFNLGLVFETAGSCRKAAESYEVALKRSPDQLEVMENLARCYLTSRTNGERARELVSRALELETRPQWMHWLEAQSANLPREHEVSVPPIPSTAPVIEPQPEDDEG